MKNELSARSAAVKEKSRELGLDRCGIAEAGSLDEEDRFGQWLEQGYHAGMQWLARTQGVRQDIRQFLPQARSVVVVSHNYYLDAPAESGVGAGRVARYAWGRDYHKVLYRRLRILSKFLQGIDPDAVSRICVDSGPVMERAWAARAGLGWIGKHGLLVDRRWGSWLVLGVLATSVELAFDDPLADSCGNCQQCVAACPTGALVAPGVLDARRCLSYHTIENRGEIPPEFHSAMADRIFGCDCCQEACPWNRKAEGTRDPDFQARPAIHETALEEFLAMDEAVFDRRFAGMALRRAKLEGIRRNARIALANRGDAGSGLT